jgi:hypothetical protein
LAYANLFLLGGKMRTRDVIGHYSYQKEQIKFETDIEKKFHKIISGMRFGDQIKVEIVVTSNAEKKEVIRAINQSALYNNIDLHKRWSKDKTYITLIVEG